MMSTPTSYLNFKDLAARRHSTRIYSSSPISAEEIKDVLTAAQLAPSACNKQPWKFYIVTNPDVKSKILSKSRPGFLDAPVVIVAVGLHNEAWHRPSDGKDHTDIDVAIAVEHIVLAAEARGLDTCWVCSFDVDATREALHLMADQEPIALLPLGRKSDNVEIPTKIRKSLDEIIEHVD